ncbi:hypothetical protein Tco_0464211 [Tanacetum coccineum]
MGQCRISLTKGEANQALNCQCRYRKLVSLPHATLIIPMCIHVTTKYVFSWTKRSSLEHIRGNPSCSSNKTECLPQIPEYVLCYALTELLAWKPLGFLFASLHTSLCHLSDGCDKTGILNDVPSEGGGLVCSARRVSIVPDHPEKFLPSKEAVYGFKNAQELWLR